MDRMAYIQSERVEARWMAWVGRTLVGDPRLKVGKVEVPEAEFGGETTIAETSCRVSTDWLHGHDDFK